MSSVPQKYDLSYQDYSDMVIVVRVLSTLRSGGKGQNVLFHGCCC